MARPQKRTSCTPLSANFSVSGVVSREEDAAAPCPFNLVSASGSHQTTRPLSKDAVLRPDVRPGHAAGRGGQGPDHWERHALCCIHPSIVR